MGRIEQLWKTNYAENLAKGVFSYSNVRSISTLVKSNSVYDKPVLLVAAGPSLENNIHIIKEYQDKFIVICADVILYRLMLEGIVPDFVCCIDPNPAVMRLWGEVDTAKLKLIAPTTFSPQIAEMWKGDIYLFNQYDLNSKEKELLLKELTRPTHDFGYLLNLFFVGATLLQVATIFKPSIIALTGYDFCYVGDYTHCRGVLSKDLSWESKLPENYVEVDNYKTSPNLLFYRKAFTKLHDDVVAKLRISIVNCTEGGLLNSTVCMPLKQVSSTLLDKVPKSQLGKPRLRKRK